MNHLYGLEYALSTLHISKYLFSHKALAKVFRAKLLEHVLPKGFRFAHNFGFLHPNNKRQIKLIQLLLRRIPDLKFGEAKKRSALCCPCCGGEMKIVRTGIKPAVVRHQAPDGGRQEAEAHR